MEDDDSQEFCGELSSVDAVVEFAVGERQPKQACSCSVACSSQTLAMVLGSEQRESEQRRA